MAKNLFNRFWIQSGIPLFSTGPVYVSTLLSPSTSPHSILWETEAAILGSLFTLPQYEKHPWSFCCELALNHLFSINYLGPLERCLIRTYYLKRPRGCMRSLNLKDGEIAKVQWKRRLVGKEFSLIYQVIHSLISRNAPIIFPNTHGRGYWVSTEHTRRPNFQHKRELQFPNSLWDGKKAAGVVF